MKNSFFIVGPTATGKSELAADIAAILDGELVSADAFQIYRGLDVLSAKPEAATLRKAPHHLIGTLPLEQEINAEKFRIEAARAIAEIRSRGRSPIVVGGSGLYIKALTHGLMRLPRANQSLREALNALDPAGLRARLIELDPKTAGMIDLKNPYMETQLRGRVVEHRADSELKILDALSHRYIGKPFPMRGYEDRIALVIEVDKVRYMKLPFEHTPQAG